MPVGGRVISPKGAGAIPLPGTMGGGSLEGTVSSTLYVLSRVSKHQTPGRREATEGCSADPRLSSSTPAGTPSSAFPKTRNRHRTVHPLGRLGGPVG